MGEWGSGPPFCAKDTDGDFVWDTATTTFTIADQFAYLVFPYRNISVNTFWSHKWSGDIFSIQSNFMSTWDDEGFGFYAARSPSFSQTGKFTVRVNTRLPLPRA